MTVPRHREGQAAALASVRQRQEEHDKIVWSHCVDAAIRGHRGNAGMIAYLEALDVPAPRGGAWSEMAVSRILQRHGVTAKSFARLVETPSWREPAEDHPQAVHAAYVAEMYGGEEPGEWLAATAVPPKRAQRCRVGDEEGQIVGEVRPGLYAVRYLDEVRLETFDRAHPATAIEVWRSHIDWEARDKRLRRKYYGR